jgi:hypothetical protein
MYLADSGTGLVEAFGFDFGGAELATLFVTTARAGLDEAALDRQPHAGHLFRFDDLGVTGTPCAPYRGHIESPVTHG